MSGNVDVYPGLRGGHGRAPADTVRIWLQVSWLMLAEGRAYVEDLEGGVEQPQMQQAARLRMLEQLADIDSRLAGREPLADAHCLAVALEHGFAELCDLTGPELVEVFRLDEELGGPSCTVDGVLDLWEQLLGAFPGELPDRLVADGQRDLLRVLRTWAGLARDVGLDVGLLTGLMKEA